MYQSLQVNGGVPWTGNVGRNDADGHAPHSLRMQQTLPMFLCPSYSGPKVTPSTAMLSGVMGNNPTTSVIGGVDQLQGDGRIDQGEPGLQDLHRPESGQNRHPALRSYDHTTIHPDGVMYPGTYADGAARRTFGDGTGTTIVACETIEQTYARWMLGTEATLAGLPSPERSGPRQHHHLDGTRPTTITPPRASTVSSMRWAGFPATRKRTWAIITRRPGHLG